MAIPRVLYGTAWKKEATSRDVFNALQAGFRAIDTAAQPRHYDEALVGAGIALAIRSNVIKREDIFIQTKFTPVCSQDRGNMPYDPDAPYEEQVHASVASSLAHFTFGDPASAYIDSLVLHCLPTESVSDLFEIWKALETYVPHRVRQLGISNVALGTVRLLCTSPVVSIRPAVVQNRFYRSTGYDIELREHCRAHDIVFQAYWVIKANSRGLRSPPVQTLAAAAAVSAPVAMYALVLGLGGTAVLVDTGNVTHMEEDLRVAEIVDGFAQSEETQETWKECLLGFKRLIGEWE